MERGETESLGLRIGVSTGETVEDDGDYFGQPVIEAARLCAAAAAGQILATDLVRLLAGQRAGQDFDPVGPMTLKGLPDPVDVFEVPWAPTPSNSASQWPMPDRLVASASHGPFGFFGRDRPMGELDDAAKTMAAEKRAVLVLVSGEPGIGKTTLAARWSSAKFQQGFNVTFGACEEGLPAPYAPWINAVDYMVEHGGPELVDELSPVLRQSLARILPTRNLGATVETEEAENDLFLLLEAVTTLLARAASETPTVIVLDDVQWADSGSLQLLRHVVLSPRPMALVVVCTYRDSDLDRTHPLRAVIADLHREHKVVRAPLSGLSDIDVVSLMERAAGHELDDQGVHMAHALRRETEGNPFFVTEMLRHLGETGQIYQDEQRRYVLRSTLAELDLPGSVRDVVERRIALLGPQSEKTLQVAAVMGREFDMDVLAAVTDRSEEDVLDELEAAVTAAILVESAATPGRFRFAHAIIQQTLYQDLKVTRRQRLHLQIAQTLEAVRGDTDAHVPELALHWLAATRPTDTHRALHYALRAADLALAAVAPGDAIDWYRTALELSPAGDQAVRARTLLGLGSAQRLAGDAAYRGTLLEAASLADEVGDTTTLVDAVITNATGNAQVAEGDEERLAAARAALGRLEEGAFSRRARVLATLAELTDSRDFETRETLTDQALSAARSSGDPATLVAVQCQTYAAIALPEHLERRRELMDQAIDLSDQLGQPGARFDTRYNRMHVAVETIDPQTYTRLFAELQEIAGDTAFPYQQWQLRLVEAGNLLLAGDLDGAERATNAALEFGTSHSISLALAVYGGQFAEIRFEQGRSAEIAGLLDEMAREPSALNLVKVSASFMSLQIGAYDEARRVYREILTSPVADVLPHDAAWSIGMYRFADVVCELEDHETARELLETLEPYAHLAATPNAVITLGSFARPVGRLAFLLGQHERAEHHLARALSDNERLGSPFHTAWTMIDLAEVLRDRAAPGDVERATHELTRARSIAQQYGFSGLLERFDRRA